MGRIIMHYSSLSINPEPAIPNALTPRIFSENEARVYFIYKSQKTLIWQG